MTIEDIKKLISAVSTATLPNSVTPTMVGAVLDALAEYLKEKTDELVTSDKLSDFLRKSADLVNGLEETLPGKALDAVQGKELKELINGLVSRKELEDFFKEIAETNIVLEFAGMADVEAAAVQDSSIVSDFDVWYSPGMRTFVAKKSQPSGGGFEPAGGYYSYWQGGEAYGNPVSGDPERKGVEPTAGKLFVDASENRLCLWNGSALVTAEELPDTRTVWLGLSGGTLEQEDYGFIRRLSEDETGSSLLRVMTLDSVSGSPAFAVASVFAEPDDGNVIVTAVLAGGIYGYSSTQEPGKTVRWEISEDRSYVAHVVYDDVLDLNTSPFIGDREDYDLQWFRILKPGVYRLIDSSIPDYSPFKFCGTLQVFRQHENGGSGIILEGSLVMSRKATAQDEWGDVVDGTDSTSGIFSVYQDPDKMNRYVLSWTDGQWVHTDLRMTEKERHAKYEPLKLKDFTANGFKIESSTDFKEKLGATFDEVSAAIATGRQVVMFDESKNYLIPLTCTNNIGLLSTYAPDTTADQISVFIGLTIESEIVTLLVIKSKDGEVGGESQKHRIQTQSA